MKIHITAGDCLNEILQAKYSDERFIPFREAMIQGGYSFPLFSDGFLKERAEALGVSEQVYRDNLAPFLAFLHAIHTYEEIVLWFGEEPFCEANKRAVIQAIADCGYQGRLIVHTVIEETGEIVKTALLQA